MTFQEILYHNRERAAEQLSRKIQLANRIAKCAKTAGGRATAYDLKASLVQKALTSFPGLFRPASFEYSEKLGLVILVRLANGCGSHLPLANFTETRSSIDLNCLPYEPTFSSRKNI